MQAIRENNEGHIELQAFNLYQRIQIIHSQPPVTPDNIKYKYPLFYTLLEEICDELISNVSFSFSNFFSRLNYICKAFRLSPSDTYAIQCMRRNGYASMQKDFHANLETYLFDLRALVCFISHTFNEKIPQSLQAIIPQQNRPYKKATATYIPYLRATVTRWDDMYIYATIDSDTDPFILIDYRHSGYDGDLCYINNLLEENIPINLLQVHVNEERHYLPHLIVVHPDYLIDISSLAACFREYGHHPLNFFINRIKPKANSSAILMGNLAGQFLDDFINEDFSHPINYKESLKKFFLSSALEFCTCPLPSDFHEQAQKQFANIRTFIHEILPQNLPAFDRHKTLLEASFICEQLGLQGRADMLQNDFSLLIEQKSGKRDEFNHRHKEDHFIQMMLYQAALFFNFGECTQNIQTFLLYSKYADGLINEHFSETLFRESIRLRNYIVTNEMKFSNGSIHDTIASLSTNTLNEYNVHNRLWTQYQEPELRTIIENLTTSSLLERAYFERFFTFITKEQVLNKTGGKNSINSGFASLWHTPLSEKIETGNILINLTIAEKNKSNPNKGYDILRLHIPQQGENILPNFRTGDIVLFYSYHELPDVRKQLLMKANVIDIASEEITILLRNGQQNKDLFGNGKERYAIEHDSSDTSTTNALRGLYTFLLALPDRKDLLLGNREPQQDFSQKLNGSYGDFNDLVLKEKQATDYFLLVGPPGTGKTSCALHYMVKEALTDPKASILLLSYTNRAVDEICNMLIDSGITEYETFIRIGNEYACSKRFIPFLLKNSLSETMKLADIQEMLKKTRIFVATTTAINSRPYLFKLKHFTTCFIDEASQITEPELIGILSAKHEASNAIDKFVLIGDYKQLPAITLQNPSDACVNHPLLNAVGITDCRHSLFERLYRKNDTSSYYILHKQGRMHPDISSFPDQTFYQREKIVPIPLPHQQEKKPYLTAEIKENNIDFLLTSRRIIFISSKAPSDLIYSEKTNINEARIVATLLSHIHSLTDDHFNPHKTVGVIVPYRNQIAMIRKEIELLNIPSLKDISIDTVERYQGSQRDVIIYSFTVRYFNQLNFLTANTFSENGTIVDRKLNVAITRARKQLILIGDPHILGCNITFYKLIKYIDTQNGYINTSYEHFCKGNFQIPSYEKFWNLSDDAYNLPNDFRQLFYDIITKPLSDDPRTQNKQESLLGNPHIQNLEFLAYGRYDFSKSRQENTLLSPDDITRLYAFYYMRKHFSAAYTLFQSYANRLFPASSISKHIVFCDFSYETGASAFAFLKINHDSYRQDITVIGFYPQIEMIEIAKSFLQNKASHTQQTMFSDHLSDIPSWFKYIRITSSDTIIFNMSNFFDRITPQKAHDIAQQINQLISIYPQNNYILIYRNDSGIQSNDHSYTAFCSQLNGKLQPLNVQMPFNGQFYYTNKKPNIPLSESFMYEIRTNLMP